MGGIYERTSGAAGQPLQGGYQRRVPERTVLHELVSRHAQTLLAELRDADGRGLPRHVERELAEYLRCGILAHGFARVRCTTCQEEIVVAFSCKRRGLCPSCTARRMADTAAHLVDHVLPRAPYRQWVVTVPKALRLRLARDQNVYLDDSVVTYFYSYDYSQSQAFKSLPIIPSLGLRGVL